MTPFLKHLNYVDDICLPNGSGFEKRNKSRVGLKTNIDKSKFLSLTGHLNLPMCINGLNIALGSGNA